MTTRWVNQYAFKEWSIMSVFLDVLHVHFDLMWLAINRVHHDSQSYESWPNLSYKGVYFLKSLSRGRTSYRFISEFWCIVRIKVKPHMHIRSVVQEYVKKKNQDFENVNYIIYEKELDLVTVIISHQLCRYCLLWSFILLTNLFSLSCICSSPPKHTAS